jgi:formylglycine-generating enzyme required for sulfatase activity
LPISAFAHALRAFQIGDLTHDELSWEIDRQLAIEKASPVALLEILKIQQVALPLPDDAHEAIVHHLQEWPQDPTIVTGLSGQPGAVRSPAAGVGDILQGRFSLIALIGEGGMSRVFKAIDLRRVEAGASDPYVAVKVLTEPISDYFGSIVALQRETHKLERLAHPNIVRVIDCDRDRHTVFMTMEYLPGESLQMKQRAPDKGAMEGPAGLALIVAVGNALQYAHENHIVHGDLKPGNVIITNNGVVKVIDFGMARFIARPEDAQTVEPPGRATPKAVTPRYASPEMVAGRDPEPADDVYALACMAYEVLSGRHPFGRQSDPRGRDPGAEPPRPAGMPRHQYAALVGGLAFDRQKRTPSVKQFMDQLLETPFEWVKKRWIWAAALAWLVTCVFGIALYQPRPHRVAVAAPAALAVPGSRIQDCPSCPSMVVLPTGHFQQGAGDGVSDASELPAHEVVINYSLAMSSGDVTVAEFREFAAATQRDLTGCNVYDGRWQFQENAGWQEPGFVQTDAHPVTCVSWDDAVAYAGWLSQKGGHQYRLPSASEWEFAARAGSAAAQPWGDDAAAACKHANVADAKAAQRYPGWSVFPCMDGYANTAPAGSFEANSFGLQDLLGNVFQWVQDCWHDDYVAAPGDGAPRQDGSCDERELRGGSWFTAPQFVTAAYRNRFAHGYRSSTVGFRVVREMDK